MLLGFETRAATKQAVAELAGLLGSATVGPGSNTRTFVGLFGDRGGGDRDLGFVTCEQVRSACLDP